MATINPTLLSTPYSGTIQLWKWAGITVVDTGAPVIIPGYTDKSVMVIGDFVTAGAITWEVTNDPALATFVVAHDAQGNNIVITANNIEEVLCNAYAHRPRATAGTAVAMDVYLLAVPGNAR
jgi:hypothetical protein